MYLLKLSLGTFFIYIGWCGLLFLMQRQMMFPCNLVEPPGTKKAIPGMETFWLDIGNGKTEVWFLPPDPEVTKGKPAPAVIFAHGNAELIDLWTEELGKFIKMGIGLMLVEYPGYGRSTGDPSQKRVTEAFVAAYDLLVKRKDTDPSQIILIGRSLGGGAVCQLALKRPSAALILMSTFTSARSFAIRYFAPGFLVRDPFDNLAVVKSYSNPVLIVHGRYDEVVPYKHGVMLYQAAKNGKMLTYHASHNDCPPDWNIFWRDVEQFLRSIGII